MKYSNKLFRTQKKKIYSLDNHLFFLAMKENLLFQYNHNKEYRELLDKMNFSLECLKCYEDLHKIPPIPTLYLKHHELLTFKSSRYLISATSSGTSGKNVSKVGLTFTDFLRGAGMVWNVFAYHRLWSLRFHRYIIFGYEPHKSNKKGVAKTANGFTYISPSISKDYAIRFTKENGYQVDLENIKKKIISYSKKKTPVRTLGFPAYTYFLLKEMKDDGIKLKLPKGSIVSLAGGWKSFYKEKVDKEKFYELVEEVLGVDDKHVFEFFGAVEHPILYTDCRYHHFHIPNYARVIIRDINTMEPIENGKIGLVNLLTPFSIGTPMLSILTDDLGILHDKPCACGETSPYLEILGRSGIDDIKTCAAGAEELLLKGKTK